MHASLKTKLSGLFLFLLIAALMQGGITIARMRFVDRQLTELLDRAVPSLNTVETISALIVMIRLQQVRVATAETQSEHEASRAAVDALFKDRDALVATHRAQIALPEEQTLFEILAAKLKTQRYDWDRLRGLSLARRETATSYYRGAMNAHYQEASQAARALVDLHVRAVEAAGRAARESQAKAVTSTVAILAAMLVVGLGATLYALLGVSRPISIMTDAMRRLAGGDTGADVPYAGRRDEIGAMSAAVQVFRQNLLQTGDLEAEAARLRAEAEDQRRQGLQALAERFETAIGGIVHAVTAAATQLQATAQTLATTASRTAARSSGATEAATDAATHVGTVAAAVEELGTSVDEIGRQVVASADLAQVAANEANATTGLVQELESGSRRIRAVVALIADIADRTNLLALNATIEAARAGIAGKGFAVVAAEVKHLAEQTAKATGEIGRQIGQIQGSSDHAVRAIDGIAARTRAIDAAAASIARAVAEQGAATQEIVRNVTQAAAGTSAVTAHIADVAGAADATGTAAGQVLEAASEMTRQAVRLGREAEHFLTTVRAA